MIRPDALTDPDAPKEIPLEGIRAQGMLADELLAKEGVTLTQGGEPTFVPEDTSAPEWNLSALGEEKLRIAWKLSRELEKTLFPGAMILCSNGKHYPGEPIPRWKLTLLRSPGKGILWKDQKRLSYGAPAKAKAVSPRKFLSLLAAELGVPGSLHPVYEDVEAAMRSASLCGDGVPLPRYSRIKKGFIQPRWKTADRKRWQSFHRAAGWVLPLDHVENVWKTDRWESLDGGDLLLLPGSSSIGLRLPLHRLAPEALPRALTAEVKEGVLTLFLPPLATAEAFSLLVSAIEKTATELDSPPLSIEGYPPPDATGWESISVIPDPGVIEVNLPPAAGWKDLERTAVALFEAAGKSGLQGTRKLPSGETVATGGGGHLVLGGPDPDHNPFLLKPHLLPSFLRFIQHHPVLSYLFSGRFIGPSSQAPRIDESLFEIPYELEIALRALETMPSPADPVMVDAMLRNLLLDLHGNTHKAEVSVDKFFNPYMPNGRLGLVEFRAIEMAPDAPSFLAIHALWRALAAVFVTRPFAKPLIIWKGKLHNDFLLPSFLEQDLRDVISYLSEAGFGFEMDWFLPHFRFRFPLLAEASVGNARWSLRRAIEPWPLLGEQPTLSGTLIRCVDSSTERLEIRLQGDVSKLRIILNGFPLPLWDHPAGGLVGAVRFRSTLLPTCLHPQVAPHVPLEFEISDEKGIPLGLWHYHPASLPSEGRLSGLLPMKKALHKKQDASADATCEKARTLDLRALEPTVSGKIP
jgi:uncharacterized protein (DUF2126 family)